MLYCGFARLRVTLVNGGNVLGAPLTFSPNGINGGCYYGRIAVKF